MAAIENCLAGNCDTFHKYFYLKSLTPIVICSLFSRFLCPNISKKLPKASITVLNTDCEKNNFAEIFVFHRRTGRFVESRSLCLSEFVGCRRKNNR